MKFTLNMLSAILGLLGIPILISLAKYTKQHENEPLEEHESFIYLFIQGLYY